uniref:Protein yippee-like n=1 Tax=Lates calcarifer TaxID=8187 RepID=A0A4W6FCP1_LATCA
SGAGNVFLERCIFIFLTIVLSCIFVLLDSKAEYGQPMTLHCAQCNTVLGDSVGVCGEIQSMDAIMCLSKVLFIHCSCFTFSIYSSLKCRGCRCAVGKVIHSAPLRLAMIRSLFLLYKANISCYILNTSSMVEASTLTFDLKPLRQNIKEVRQQNIICLF